MIILFGCYNFLLLKIQMPQKLTLIVDFLIPDKEKLELGLHNFDPTN